MKNLCALFLILLACLTAPDAQAFENADNFHPDLSSFAQIPVQHEGRIKPLDTLARAYAKEFSGRTNPSGLHHRAWLAETLFDPAAAMTRPVFRVFRAHDFGLPERKNRLYSYAELSTALQARRPQINALLQTPPNRWSDDQESLMKLHEQSLIYAQLLRSFSHLLPLNLPIPASLVQSWDLDREQQFITLRELKPYETRLNRTLAQIVAQKGENWDGYSAEEQAIAAFAFQIEALREGGENNILLRVIPSDWDGAQGAWFSPWAITQSGHAGPGTAAHIALWEEAAQGWLHRDTARFEAATQQLAAMNPATTLSLEILYNRFAPLSLATALYIFAFFTVIAASFRPQQTRLLGAASWAFTGLGALAHILAIAGRIIILERPPVGTLYESVLFVALICVLTGALIEYRRRDGLGMMCATLSGFLLLIIARGFAPSDTMAVLGAVLNTNFWLATHVLTITIGYGVCLVTAFFAHLFLFYTANGKESAELNATTRTLGLFALLLTATGTILGGIWADQSWGRFWGWDPKENGALLIVLWLVWLYHGALAGQLSRALFMAGMALLSVIVALAWFGVNLLNVGLHSYGFISGVAGGLLLFCLLETALVGALWYKAKQRKDIR